MFPTEVRTLLGSSRGRSRAPEPQLLPRDGFRSPEPQRRGWHACLWGLEWGQEWASGEKDKSLGQVLSSIVGQLAAAFKTLVLCPHFVLILRLFPGAQICSLWFLELSTVETPSLALAGHCPEHPPSL